MKNGCPSGEDFGILEYLAEAFLAGNAVKSIGIADRLNLKPRSVVFRLTRMKEGGYVRRIVKQSLFSGSRHYWTVTRQGAAFMLAASGGGLYSAVIKKLDAAEAVDRPASSPPQTLADEHQP